MTAVPDLPPPQTAGRWRWIRIFFRWIGRLLAAALLVWLVWFVASGQWRNEMARWHLAAGVTADSVEELREHIAQARRWAPRDAQVLLAAARVEAADGQVADALDLCAAAAEVLGEFPVEAWRTEAEILQRAGRFTEAVGAVEQILNGVRQRHSHSTGAQQAFWELQLASALNDVAYARALADQDVAQALPEIEQALELAGENSAMLDTRGYALWRLGQAEPARRDLDRAVELAENELAVFLRRDFPRLEKERVDMRPVLRQARLMQRSVAVLRYHRAMAVQGSDPERARADLQRVETLGFKAGPELY